MLGLYPAGAAARQVLWDTDTFSAGLPSYWYAGDEGRKPEVRSQGKYGTCWALTAAGALENALLPQQEIVFSAEHMVLQNAFSVPVEAGGDYFMLMAYLSGWQGPVTEGQDPYGDMMSPEDLVPAVHVQEMQLLRDKDTDAIKEAVYRYGSVQTSLYMNRSAAQPESDYYNEITNAYYVPEERQQNHDVLILGWDDSFSRFHFRQIPEQDGAFICQNTWGAEFGEDGIFYVSYADGNIAETGMVYSKIEAADNYDSMYQTDVCGWQGSLGYEEETAWFANVYTAEEVQQLAAVGLYAVGDNAQWELYLVHAFENTDSFENLEFLQNGSARYAGYYTEELETPVLMEAGERFALVVKMTVPDTGYPVAVEYKSGEETQQVVTDGKEGYISQTGKRWQNTEQSFGANVCLKGYVNAE